MNPLFTLLASQDDEMGMCYHAMYGEDSLSPWPSFWNYLLPDGLSLLVGFFVLGLLLIVTVRCIMNFWKVIRPFPRSWWFYLVLLAASALVSYFWYRIQVSFDSLT